MSYDILRIDWWNNMIYDDYPMKQCSAYALKLWVKLYGILILNEEFYEIKHVLPKFTWLMMKFICNPFFSMYLWLKVCFLPQEVKYGIMHFFWNISQWFKDTLRVIYQLLW